MSAARITAFLQGEQAAVIVLNRGLAFRERNELLRAYLAGGEPRPRALIVDLSRLERIDVVSISAVLRLREALARHGCEVRVSGCGPAVREALGRLGIDRLIPIEPPP